MLNDDVVHARSGWCTGEPFQGEGPVGIGNVLVEQSLLCGSRARHELGIGHRRQVGEDAYVLHRCAVGHVPELPRDGDGVRSVASHRHGGDGLIDDFDFLCRRTGVKRNPTKVGVPVGAVLLKANFGPRGDV